MMAKQQILIIDDDSNIRKTLSDILKVKGHEPLTAKNGAEGLELLRQSSVNLVIIDLALPDMSGLEVLSRVKADHPSTEAIILTGNASLDSAIEATNKGAFSYLQKPYEIDQLMLHIRRAIEKHEAEEKIVRHSLELEKINAQLSEKNRELAKEIAERRRAEERLSKEVELKNFLLDLYEKAPALTDKELYDYVLDHVVRLTDSAIGFFHLVSDDQRDVILTTWNMEALRNCTASYATHYPIEQAGNWVDCVRLKRPVIYNDFPCLPNQKGLPEGHTPVLRFMSVPVVEEDKVRIIFGVGNKSEEYSEIDAIQIQVVANDLQRIMAQRRAEESLKRSEAYFRSLIENSSDIITILNDDGTVRYISPSLEHIAGYKQADLMGRNIFEYVHPDDVSAAMDFFARAIQNPRVTLSGELRLWHNDSSWHIYEIAAQNLLENEAVKGIVVNSHDITVRRQAEEEAQKMLYFLQTVMETIPSPIFYKDTKGIYRGCNKAFEDFIGLKKMEIIGKSVYDLSPKELADKYHEMDSALFRQPGKQVYEYQVKYADGSRHDVIYNKATYLNVDGTPAGLVGIMVDITERKRTEGKIQASLREKETLLKEIHHRVKNNLQVISSLLSLQSRYLEDKKLLEIFRESENRVRTMALVHKMLYQSEDLSAVGFDSFISNLVGVILQSYRKDSSAIKINMDVHDIQLDIAAAIPFGLILNELISNALKHAFPGEAKGEISLIMRVEGGRIVARFQDSGIGFPETLDFRNTQSLGLQLVNILVGQLRGTIDLAVDGGTTFNITFPIPDKKEEQGYGKETDTGC